MSRLSEQKSKTECVIRSIEGTERFIGRAVSMGFTENAKVEVIQNSAGNPMLVYARDTTIAISRKEAKNILVEEVRK